MTDTASYKEDPKTRQISLAWAPYSGAWRGARGAGPLAPPVGRQVRAPVCVRRHHTHTHTHRGHACTTNADMTVTITRLFLPTTPHGDCKYLSTFPYKLQVIVIIIIS